MKVTIKDVAKAAEVSTATVSYVLNNTNRIGPQTRERVMQAVERLGYKPSSLARGSVANRTNTIGLVIPHTADFIFSDPYFPELLKGIGTVASEAGYFLLLSMPPDKGNNADLALINEKRVDGVILVCTPRESQQVELLKRVNLPFVLIGETYSYSSPSVDVDNEGGSYAITKHLISLGHRHIGYISGDMQLDYAVMRYRGYQRALIESGLESKGFYMGDFTQKSGTKGGKELISQDITAVVCANDLMALGAIQAAKQLGLRVPTDVSVAGFDDIPLANQQSFGLTTVRQPVKKLGTTACELLLEMLKTKGMSPQKLMLPTELVIRESTTESYSEKTAL